MAKPGAKLVQITQDINPFSLMEDFLLRKRAEGVTSFTISSHRSALRNFLTEYQGNIKQVPKLKQSVYIFLSDKKNGYYNKLLQALRQFFEYLIGEGLIHENPCTGLKYKRSNVRIVHHDEKVIKAFLDIPDKGTFAGLRDYVIMIAIIDTGIRPNEILQIKIKDIDFLNAQIYIREEYAKTRQPRIVPLSGQTINGLKKVINARHPDWELDTPVFCSFSGHRLTSHNLQERFREYSQQLGTSVTPYHLRHTFALWFIRNGGNVFSLQKIMGHTKLDMTKTYVDLVQADIKESHIKASPLKNIFIQNQRVNKIK